MAASELVSDERFALGRTSLRTLGSAYVFAVLSTLTALGIVSIGKFPVLGADVTFAEGTPTSLISLFLAVFAIVAGVAASHGIKADAAAFNARVAHRRREAGTAAAQRRAEAAGGVIEPEDLEVSSTGAPALPLRRLAWLCALPTPAVVAGIIVVIAAIT